MLRSLYILLAACAVPLSASAWLAAATNDYGASFFQANSSTPELATRLAMEGCEKGGFKCKLLGPPVHNAVCVVAKGPTGQGLGCDALPVKAQADALQRCATKSDGCRVVSAAWDKGTYWAAAAKAGQFVRVGLSSRQDEAVEWAKADVAEVCEKAKDDGIHVGSCVPTVAIDPQFGRLFYAEASNSQTSVGLSFVGSQDARRLAMDSCEKDKIGKGRCKIDSEKVFGESGLEPDGLRELLMKARSK